MRVVYTFLLLLMTIATLQACKKKDQATVPVEDDPGTAAIQIKSSIKDSVYLLLNGHDITTGVIPHIIKMTLAPEEELTIPRADLRDAYTYEYSWHTADYMYSNWWKLDENSKPKRELITYYSKSESDFSIDINSTMRRDLLICLDGDGLSSTWEPIDAFDKNGTSVWDTISEKGRNHSFTINRYHAVKHRFIDTADEQTITNLSFVLDVSAPRTWLRIEEYADNYVLTNNLEGIAALQTNADDQLYYANAVVDTNGVTVFNGPYYLLSRKSVDK